MKRLHVLLIALLTLSTAFLGWHAFSLQQELDRLRHSGLAVEERDNWQKRVTALEKRLVALTARAPVYAKYASGDAGDARDQRPGEFDGPGSPPGADRGRRENAFMALANTPEFQKLMSAQQRGALESRYAALFKGLSLAPADLEKFKTLLADKQSAVFDVLAAARAQGLTGRENRDQVQQMIQAAQSEVDQSMQQLLGAQAYGQYQNYETTLPQRTTVDLLEKRLSYTQTPLTEQQSRQLMDILVSTGSTDASGSFSMPGGAPPDRNAFGLGGAAPIKDQALQLAQGVLAGPQLSVLQQLQQEQQAAQQLSRLMRNPPPAPSSQPDPTPASKGKD
ncbi:MAG: hypothetical protein WC378_03520 [Opitutaceae bacterium]|jgi:hypothetical protein